VEWLLGLSQRRDQAGGEILMGIWSLHQSIAFQGQQKFEFLCEID
jgi:hypothetical protein